MPRGLVALCLLAGCGRIFGLEPPEKQSVDASVHDVSVDVAARTDATLGGCTSDMNLVACFDFENSIVDSAPSPNAVTTSNISFGPGKLGAAVVVNASSRMQVADSVMLDVSAVTMEAWVLLTAAPAVGARFGVWDTDGEYGMFIKPGPTLACQVGGVDAGTIALNQWTHVACTADSSKAVAYVNGAIVGEALTGMPLQTTPVTGAEMAGDAPAGDDRLLGRIDAVRVYRVVRTPQEICQDAGCAAP